MRIIGAGWGRTGTTSLAAALSRLGAGPCLHMHEMWEHPELADVFLRYTDGATIDWTSVLREWQSGADWPVCWAWRELLELYPEAPVLLTVRDSAAWYESVLASIHQATAPGRDVGPPYMRTLLDRMWQIDFGGWTAVLDRDRAIAAFERHNDEVRRLCPPDRLVEWQVEDGWDPLGTMLGVALPDEPFPRLNSRARFIDAGDTEAAS